ncbi:MAG TPA: molybdate ABC transporter permease subunit [Candidatus Dormibacteraeota bacterium]|nr:molybdate ABC transporter permease subunit [Candidatus Dormibacteraeota bacterium]
MQMPADLAPVWTSLRTAVTATVITLVLGVAAARWRLRGHARTWELLDALLLLPLVLPPTVVGFFLLLLLGKHGPLGQLLMKLGVVVVFSWPATVIAASVVAFPLMYVTARGALEQLDPQLLQAARTLGASEWRVFWRVAVPLAWPGIVAGVILSFARALGEFGATLMLAGNIPGKTETLPVAIFFAIESGQTRQAALWVAIVMVISFAVLAALAVWTRRQRQIMALSQGRGAAPGGKF